MSTKELAALDSLCVLMGYSLHDEKCQILSAALHAAKLNLPRGTPRRVFIQDFAAALNRRKLLPNDKVDDFHRNGYYYMEI